MTGATRPLMVCLDLDGTTIDYSSVLHPPVRDAVRATSAAGHTVVVATGVAYRKLPVPELDAHLGSGVYYGAATAVAAAMSAPGLHWAEVPQDAAITVGAM